MNEPQPGVHLSDSVRRRNNNNRHNIPTDVQVLHSPTQHGIAVWAINKSAGELEATDSSKLCEKILLLILQ